VSTPGVERWLAAAVEGLPADPHRELVMHMDPHLYIALQLARTAPVWPPPAPPVPQWGHAEVILEHGWPRGGWVLCLASGSPVHGGVLTADQLAGLATPADPFGAFGEGWE
jgi:hypothetical protein